jgi:antitoxin VapB
MREKLLAVGKIFMHGRSQALRLPKAFRFDGSEVYLRRVGAEVVVTPKPKPAISSLIESLSEFDLKHPIERGQPELPQLRESFTSQAKLRSR